jgi:prophage regulatory protein
MLAADMRKAGKTGRIGKNRAIRSVKQGDMARWVRSCLRSISKANVGGNDMENPENKLRPTERLLRVKQVLQMVPVGRSTWWAGVKSGRFPQPVKLGPRTTAWRLSDIEKLIREGIDG